MHQNTFGGRAPPDPLAAMSGLTSIGEVDGVSRGWRRKKKRE